MENAPDRPDHKSNNRDSLQAPKADPLPDSGLPQSNSPQSPETGTQTQPTKPGRPSTHHQGPGNQPENTCVAESLPTETHLTEAHLGTNPIPRYPKSHSTHPQPTHYHYTPEIPHKTSAKPQHKQNITMTVIHLYFIKLIASNSSSSLRCYTQDQPQQLRPSSWMDC